MYNPDELVFETEIKSNINVVYGIEDVPKPWWKTLYFALQVTLVDFTPFIWASMFVSIAGLDGSAVLPTMISASFFCMFFCTLLQGTIGNRLPIVQGPSSALASSMGSVAAVYGLPAVWGSIFIGSIVEGILGLTRVMSKIRKLLPPVVIGSVVTSIGFVAARIALQWTFSNQSPLYLGLAFVAFLLALFLKFMCKGLLSQGFILITVLVVGVLGGTVTSTFNWADVIAAPWFSLPKLFPFTGLEGQSGAIVEFLPIAVIGVFSGFVGSMFESVGDYAATCSACDAKYKVKHIDRGIMAEGFGCFFTAFFGGLPCTSYTQNIGIIASTGVCSRVVTIVAACLFGLYSICPKLAYILSGIPRSVIGAVFLVTAATMMFSGIDTIVSDKRTIRNTIIAGTTLGVAIMLPFHAASTYAAWVSTLPAFVNMFVTSPTFISVVVGILMNILLNHIMKDRNEDTEAKIELEQEINKT